MSETNLYESGDVATIEQRLTKSIINMMSLGIEN